MSIASEIFESGFDLYKFLTTRAQSKSVLARLLLREIRDNLKRLEHRNKKEVNRLKLIEMLSNEHYVNAVSNGFKFSKLTHGNRIDSQVIDDIDTAKKYINWDAEKLLNSIDAKIVSLKDLVQLYDNLDDAPLNVTSRLNNLYLQLVLLTYLIRKAEK